MFLLRIYIIVIVFSLPVFAQTVGDAVQYSATNEATIKGSLKIDVENDATIDLTINKSGSDVLFTGPSNTDTIIGVNASKNIKLQDSTNSDIEIILDNNDGTITRTFGTGHEQWQVLRVGPDDFVADGTQCTGPSNSTVNGGQIRSFTCADNDAGRLRMIGRVMPNNWNLGDVRIQATWQDPDGASVVAAIDAFVRCAGDGEAITASWSTGNDVDTTLATANAPTSSSRTADITPAGTCAQHPAMLFMEFRVDAINFDTGANNALFLGASVFYQTTAPVALQESE